MKLPICMTTDQSVSCVFPDLGKNVTIQKSSQPELYEQCMDAFRCKGWEVLQRLMVPEYKVEVETNGKVKLFDGDIYFMGIPVKENALSSAIRRAMIDKLPFLNLVSFMENVYAEDVPDVVKAELYEWLERNDQAMFDAEGYVIAYRNVDNNYNSFHANKDGSHNTNRVGDVVSMPREECNDDRRNECSYGLHFCSFSYLPSYHGGSDTRTMIIRIHPRDMIAIPKDYNFAKGRCCQYEVIGEVDALTDKRVTHDNVSKTTEKAMEKVVAVKIVKPTTVVDAPVAVNASQAETDAVKKAIENRLTAGKVVVARGAAKSTKPYVKAIRFVEIARQLGYKIVDKVPVSETIIEAK
jgi:hypothetical protein